MFVSAVNCGINVACNNAPFVVGTIPAMAEELHESARRLYDVAKQMLGIDGQAAMAKLLNESPQAVNNWERRGLSERAALKAQAMVGADANWLLTGEGSSFAGWPFPRVKPERYFGLKPEDQTWVQARVQQAIEECEASAKQSAATVLSQARGVLNRTGTGKERPKKKSA